MLPATARETGLGFVGGLGLIQVLLFKMTRERANPQPMDVPCSGGYIGLKHCLVLRCWGLGVRA